MIISIRCKETERIWNGIRSKKYSFEVQKIARRKLRMLNNSIDLNDIRKSMGNRLELLKGDRKGQYSIRINDQWRICFNWKSGNVYNVEIVDYH